MLFPIRTALSGKNTAITSKNRDLLFEGSRKKNCTVRLGDVRSQYPESSIVWITTGKKYEVKKRLYTAIIDKVRVKKFAELTSRDLGHQNPEIDSLEGLRLDFENIYQRRITLDDTVTVIYFSEVL